MAATCRLENSSESENAGKPFQEDIRLSAGVVQTLTDDFNIVLQANQPYADSQRRTKTIYYAKSFYPH